jgi:hypothetical protein
MLVSDAAQSTSQMDAPHGGSRHEATLPVLRASPWAQRRSSPADCARPRAYRREATRVFRGRAAAVWPPPWWGLSLSLRRCFPALPWRWRPPHCRATVIASVPVRELTTSATASVPGLPACTTRHLQAQPCESPWSNQGLTCQRVQTETTLLLFLPCEAYRKAIPGESNLCAPLPHAITPSCGAVADGRLPPRCMAC